MNQSENSRVGKKPGESGKLPVRRISSEQLLAGGRELIIDHGGEEYRLLRTRNGKLILIK